MVETTGFENRHTARYREFESPLLRPYTNPDMEGLPTRQESDFERIDQNSPEILNALAMAPIYQKFGEVQAHQAVVGETVTTTLADGRQETTNTAKEGDWIVTNPNGEQYLIAAERFLSRYENTPQDGVYSAKGFCKAILNPYGKPIEIMASWGSPQTGDERCMIADVCDENGHMSEEPYLIEESAFRNTYRLINDSRDLASIAS